MSGTDQNSAPDPQLLFVGRPSRLLEVYVKRSLSLNDSPLNDGRPAREHRKWISLAERNKRDRRHSSDTSLHLPVDMAYSYNPVSEKNSDPKKSTLRKKWMSFRDKSKRPSKLSKPSLVVKPAPSDDRPTEYHDTMPSDLESSTEKPKKKKRESKKGKPAPSDDRPTEYHDTMPSDLESSTEKPKKKKRESKKGKPAPSDDRPAEDHDTMASGLESSTEKPKKKKQRRKKGKKSSIWRSIVGFFSRGDSDTDERDLSPVRTVCPPQPPEATCLSISKPFSEGEEVTRRRKSSRRRRSLIRRLSQKKDRRLSIVEAIERVEPTDSYYENVSDELKRIVTEVMDSPSDEQVVVPPDVPPTDTLDSQSLSTDELTERLIALIKQEGDFMDAKMKESPSLSNFFQGLTYGSFQQLADQYVLSEIPAEPAQDPVVAPELVRLAFTLDFTARLAGLSRQSPSHIMGHGKCYLQERFTYEAQPEVEPTSPLMMRTAWKGSMEIGINYGNSLLVESGEPEEHGLGKAEEPKPSLRTRMPDEAQQIQHFNSYEL